MWRSAIAALVAVTHQIGSPTLDAQAPSRQERNEQTQPPLRIDPTLVLQTQANGRSRVILKVRTPWRSEGLLGPEERSDQRRAISVAQELVRNDLQGSGARLIHDYETIPFQVYEITAAALERLRSTDLVSEVEPDRALPPVLAESGPLVQADQAWASGYDGTGVAVAILDTGIESSHSFFGGRLVAEGCFSTNDVNVVSLCPNGDQSQVGPGAASPSGCAGVSSCDHGTHVTGIAAGSGTTFSGIAKSAPIVGVQVFSKFTSFTSCGFFATPCLLSFVSDQIRGLEHVLSLKDTHQIAAVNMSLGGGKYTSDVACDLANGATKAAIDNLRSVGIATVIAAGNNTYLDGISSPGCISTAVAVGSTTKTDLMSTFSNSSEMVELLAPGSSIASSVTGNGFAFKSGTSMAAPHVTGAWAVLKQRKPGAPVAEILNDLSSTGLALTDPRNAVTKPRIRIKAALDLPFSPALYIASANVSEGDAGSKTANFTVTLSPAATNPVTVHYATTNGTATAGSDYTSTSGVLTFAPGEVTKIVSVLVHGDTFVEDDEVFFVDLSAAEGAPIAEGRGQGRIRSDDDYLTCPATVNPSRSFSSTVRVGANPADWVGLYAAGQGLNSPWLALEYVPMPRPATVSFVAPPDLGSYELRLFGNDAGRVIGSCFFTVSMTPTISVSDATVTESTTNQTFAQFTVTLSLPRSDYASVLVAIVDGTAQAGIDYLAPLGDGLLVTFAPGHTSEVVTISVSPDAKPEPSETFFAELLYPSPGTSILDGWGKATILDDDPLDTDIQAGFPVQGPHTPGSYQGGPGIHALVGNIDSDSQLEILATGLTAGPLHAWKYTGTPATGWDATAIPGEAYSALGELSLESPGLEVVSGHAAPDLRDMIVARRGDSTVLPGWPRDSSNYVGFPPTLADVDGDGIDEIFVEEEDSRLHAYRADGSPLPGWPPDPLGGGQARHTPAVADLDGDGDLEIVFTSSDAGGVYLYAYHHEGVAVAGFPVSVLGDSHSFVAIGDVDGDGSLEIVLIGQVPGGRSAVRVHNANGTLKRSITLPDIATYGGAPALADMDGDSIPEIVVQSGGFLNVVRGDGTSLPGWPAMFDWASGQGAPVVGDVDGDGQPDIVVATYHSAFGGLGEVRLYDRYGNLHPRFPKVIEIGSGATPAIADIDRDGRNEIIIAGAYWNGLAGEFDRVWVYDLGGANHGPIQWGQFMGGPRHQGRYESPQPPPTALPAVSANDISYVEGNSVTSTATFTVRLMPAASEAISVDYSTVDGTALAWSDYEPVSGTLTFAPGETTKTVSVPMLNDVYPEESEALFLRLSALAGAEATIADGLAVATIVDDDFVITIDNVNVIEGQSGNVGANFTVSLYPPAPGNVTVNFSTANGTATSGTDYVATSGTLIFASGQTAKIITVPIVGERIYEKRYLQ